MKSFFKEMHGSWILFFHYLKWPVAIGWPILYLDMGFDRNIIMDIIWVYCVYLAVVGLYEMYRDRGKPKSCGSGGCGSGGCSSEK